MDKIYVLVTGEYSDWRIHGFVETEEEAIKNCMIYNKKYDEDMYYEEVDMFKKYSKEELNKIKLNYKYEFWAFRTASGWEFEFKDILEQYESVEESIKKDFVRFFYSNYDTKELGLIKIYLTLPEVNRERAFKIAQDMLYKELAKREGV